MLTNYLDSSSATSPLTSVASSPLLQSRNPSGSSQAEEAPSVASSAPVFESRPPGYPDSPHSRAAMGVPLPRMEVPPAADPDLVSPISKVAMVPTSSELLSLYGPKPVRAQFACDYCRQRKAKCSGTEPCDRCVAKDRPCIFSTVHNQRKVTRSLRDLRAERGPAAGRSSGSQSPPGALKLYFDRLHQRGSTSSAFGSRNHSPLAGEDHRLSTGPVRRVASSQGMGNFPLDWNPHLGPPNVTHLRRAPMSATHGSHHYLNGHGPGDELSVPAGVFYSAQTSPSFSPYAAQANGCFEGPPPVGLGIDYHAYPGPAAAPVNANGAFEATSEQLQVPLGAENGYHPNPAGWRYAPVPPPPAPLTYAHSESGASGHEWPIANSMSQGDSVPTSAEGRLPGVASYTQAPPSTVEHFGHHDYHQGTQASPASRLGLHEEGQPHRRGPSPLQHATEHDLSFQPPDVHDG